MRFVFYLFIFSQLFNFVSVLADKYTKESPESKIIKWKKIQEKNSNDLKKIIWKSYKDDESYFQNNNEESPEVKKTENSIDENNYKSKRKSNRSILEIEPYLPLNNFLEYGDFQTSVRWKSSFDGGVSGGTGQQNPSFIFDYGMSDSSLLTIYITGADDDLYNLVEGQRINYYWQNYAVSFKKKLLDEKDSNFGLSLVSTLEYWRHASGSETSKSIYNQKDNSFGKDKFESLIGSLSLPFSKDFSKQFKILLVPGITFLPEELGNKGIGKNSYGNNFI